MPLQRVGATEIAVEVLGNSGPTIVFESGLAQDMVSWSEVVHTLAACARTVRYDRLGIGKSGPRDTATPVLASAVVDELSALLRVMRLPPPYVLVGHSLGGLYVQAYARARPQEIAAVVLVDSASPFEPPGVFGLNTPAAPGSVAAAEEAGFTPSVAAMLAGPPFPPVPLIVLVATSHGVAPEIEALWQDVQARTAALSPKGRLEIVQGSGHCIQIDRPQAVVKAVVWAAREAGTSVSGCLR